MRPSHERRPYRPPDRDSPPPHRYHHQHHRQPPLHARQYAVILLRASPTSSTPSATEIDALVAGLKSPPPDSLSVCSSGRQGARLLFRSLLAAAEAACEVWSLRLEGLHFLTPYLADAPLAAHAYPLIASLFASHASRLLDSGLLSHCAARSAELAVSIQSVKHRLRCHNRLGDFDQLNLQKKTLEAEKDLVDDKIAEYKAAMSSIRRAMLCGTDEEEVVEDEAVDVFGIGEGEDVDFVRLHMMMMRECRRLNEGLPIYAYRRKILNHIFNNQVMILIGETGSGKSTQLVQFLADSGLAANGSIVCTQPRKVAALSLAHRVDEESKGCYKDNFVASYSSFLNSQDFSSKIIFCTDSCLLHHYMNDTDLNGISYIIIDEAHERSLNTDLLLASIKKKLFDRLDLRLIIMSATADANRLAEYFYGCQTFHVKGRNFPVEIKYVPNVSAEASFNTGLNYPRVACATSSYDDDVIRQVKWEQGSVIGFTPNVTIV